MSPRMEEQAAVHHCPQYSRSRIHGTIYVHAGTVTFEAPGEGNIERTGTTGSLRDQNYKSTLYTVFEDSTGCIALANCTTMTPRSKHIAGTYHWFRNHVMRGDTAIVKIDTTQQLIKNNVKGEAE
jgi:hypothetical protein